MSDHRGANSLPVTGPGSHTYNQICSQPTYWTDCLTERLTSSQLEQLRRRFARTRRWRLVGCGSCHYIALSAAASMSRLSGVSARAIPACDIVLYPKLVFAAREMPQEMKSLGTTTLVIANQADESARAAADLFVELSLDVPEIARLAGFICPVQLLGLYTGLEKGADPDRPRNLSRFVVLEEGTKSHHASL